MPGSASDSTLSGGTKILFSVALAAGLVTVVAVGAVQLNADKVDYNVESSTQPCDRQHTYQEYSELSPPAQEVFRSTLRAEGEYTTRTRPDDFTLQTDTQEPNYVQYKSECYQLTAHSRGGFGTGFSTIVLVVLGGGVTATFAFVFVLSYERDRRRNSLDTRDDDSPFSER